MAEVVNARKTPLNEKDALALAADADEIYATKGGRVIHLDLRREQPARADLLALLLGPTGNLRAPTLRRGRTLLVGFDESTWGQVIHR